jgi:hypothetical protein
MTIHTIQIRNAPDDLRDEMLEVTMRGKAEEIVKVLVNGLPREALEQVRDAMTDELAIRRGEATSVRSTRD